MNIIEFRKVLSLWLAVSLLGQNFVQATGMSLDETFKFFKEESVTVASKRPQSTHRAPGIVTIVTSEQIERMGARNLLDVLRFVPGMSETVNQFGLHEIEVRGFRTTESTAVKLMMNGHSLNNGLFGEATRAFDDIALHNVKRIEIIRGPGSTLYGSGAVLSMINLVTKDADDVQGFRPYAASGSFHYWNGGLEFNKSYGDLTLSGLIDFFETEGAKLDVPKDALSTDKISALRNASLAPGKTRLGETKRHYFLKLNYKNFSFQGLASDKKREPFIGPNLALVRDGETHNQWNHRTVEMSYAHPFTDSLKVKPRVYYSRFSFELGREIRPPGSGSYNNNGTPKDTNGDGINDVFPEGMLLTLHTADNVFGEEVQADYNVSDRLSLVAGQQIEHIYLNDIRSNGNVLPGANTRRRTTGDFSESELIQKAKRTISSYYLQAQAKPHPRLETTIGGRYDAYSDAPDALSPRFGVVWNPSDPVYAKFLYAESFRAPSLGDRGRPDATNVEGNPNLKPENAHTFETSLEYVENRFKMAANLFYFLYQDRIVRVSNPKAATGGAPLTFANSASDVISQGVETQVQWKMTDRLKNVLNYSYAFAHSAGDEMVSVAAHKGTVGLELDVLKWLNLNGYVNYTGRRKRSVTDGNPLPGFYYGVFTANAKEIRPGLSVSFSVYNAFNEAIRDASTNSSLNDFPREDLSFAGQISYRF